MGKPKFDGVVEAVRYKTGGTIDWVRAYERRGPTWSDHVLLSRSMLIERLKSGKVYMTGKRVEFMAGTFEVSAPLTLAKGGSGEIITTGNRQLQRDTLEGVPVI